MAASVCLRVVAEREPDSFESGATHRLFFSGSQRLADLDVEWLCSLALAAENLVHLDHPLEIEPFEAEDTLLARSHRRPAYAT